MHASVCDFILDITQNSIEAGASEIEVAVEADNGTLTLTVKDNGKGMTEQQLQKAYDPFYSEEGKHSRRKAGLGIPFLKQAVEATDGSLEIRSEPGKGTTLRAQFMTGHVDAPPFGNLALTAMSLMSFPETFDLTLKRRCGAAEYAVSRTELTEALGGLDDADNLILAKKYIQSLENELIS